MLRQWDICAGEERADPGTGARARHGRGRFEQEAGRFSEVPGHAGVDAA